MAVARKSLFIYVLSMINWSRTRVHERYPMSVCRNNEIAMVHEWDTRNSSPRIQKETQWMSSSSKNSACRHRRSNLFLETLYSSFWNFPTRCQWLFANIGSTWCHVPTNVERRTAQNCEHGWRSVAGEFGEARNWSAILELSSVSIYRPKAHLKRLLLTQPYPFHSLEHSLSAGV